MKHISDTCIKIKYLINGGIAQNSLQNNLSIVKCTITEHFFNKHNAKIPVFIKIKSKLTNIFAIYLLFIAFGIIGCNGNTSTENEFEIETKGSNKILKSVSKVFETLPSPIETSKLIIQADVKFNYKILNPVKNVPYYESSKSLALNLGIYCADMSYISYYDQKQLTLEYLSAIKTLADNLGIIQVMNKSDIIKLEDNIYNQDSIRVIVEDLFFNSGEYLNENNRPEMALLVQVGGWIEGLYIAMQLATQSIQINKELVDRIVEQRESLDRVVESLKNYSDNPLVFNVYNDMLQLQNIYNKTIIPEQDTMPQTTKSLTSKANAKVTPEIFISLFKEINKIRNDYTQ
ncbi:MAG: hypothetical protein B6I20_03615 [Bacteroidetes bacterium 4572_117]|nr:MAG: hypothetical protein B6I20_03615 [Bacteroidetes bacterium 4572_117]